VGTVLRKKGFYTAQLIGRWVEVGGQTLEGVDTTGW